MILAVSLSTILTICIGSGLIGVYRAYRYTREPSDTWKQIALLMLLAFGFAFCCWPWFLREWVR